MDTHLLIRFVGGLPIFATRAFLATFLTALVARFGLPGYFPPLPEAPAWFVADSTLWILGALALAEIAAEKSSEIRDLLIEYDPEIKALLAAISSGALISGNASKLLAQPLEAGFSFAQIWTLLIGGGVWLIARTRRALLLTLSEMDPEDDLHLRRVISWIEDFASLGGMILVFIAPVLCVIVAGATTLLMVLLRRYLKAKEEQSKVACASCQSLNWPTALQCFSCRTPNPSPAQLTWLGRPGMATVTHRPAHELSLLAHKRCPSCAEWLPEPAIHQKCPACGTVVFQNTAAVEAYLAAIQERLPKTLVICFAWSLIPVVGLIPGIIYYRLTLIRGLRGYLPRSKNLLARWILRLWNGLLFAFQWVPLLGSITLPMMAYTNFLYYRHVVTRESMGRLPRTAPVPGAASPIAGTT